MVKKNLSLPVEFSINKEFENKDGRFISVIIDVLNTGLNYNNSIFEKEIVDANIESIKNTPILGFIQEVDGEKNFTGHEYRLKKTEDGFERFYVGSAYGVIPESCNPRWITKMCSDGQERETLRVDAILWSKFSDSSDIMLRDLEKGHSMELYPDSVNGYEDENGIFHFEKFSFDGCCILGDVEPAMIDSKIEVNFSINDFVKQIQDEIINKYEIFTKLVKNETNQGGINIVNTKEGNKNLNFTQTVLQHFEDISVMVKEHETIKDVWGYDCPRYYAVDIQDDEIIVVDRADNYRYYGFAFTMNGDKTEIDFASRNRKKLRYENYEESNETLKNGFDFGEHISKIENSAFEKVKKINTTVESLTIEKETVETNYSKIKTDFDKMKINYDNYVEQENKRKTLIETEKKNNIFSRFESVLNETSEFIELKNNMNNFSIDEIKNKCSVMYADKMISTNNINFEKNNNTHLTVNVNDTNFEDSNSNFISTKYGNIQKN